MSSGRYAVEVTGLSAKATEKDLYDFFAFSGDIEHVEIIRYGDYLCTGYVTFKNAYSQETALLLSGASIAEERVCITRWGNTEEDNGLDLWSSWRQPDEIRSSSPHGPQSVPTAGEAVAAAQEVVKTMLSKGFTLSKDALTKAKSLDESYQISATAMAKVADLTERSGLADKLFAGVEAVRSVDNSYHVSEHTKSAVSAAGRTAAAAATTVVNSSYFSKGALWLSDALNRASKAAADLGTHNAQHSG